MNYEDKRFNSTKIIIFIVMGGALVILSELFIFGGIKNIMDQRSDGVDTINVVSLRQQHDTYMDDGIYIDPSMLKKITPPKVKIARASEDNDIDEISITIDEILANQKAVELASIMPAIGVDKGTEKNYLLDEIMEEQEEIEPNPSAVTTIYDYDEPKGNGMIAIIIDDMGVSLRSKLVEVLPAPLTLSYLPYAKNLKERTARAVGNGHELMVHMPMEAMSKYNDGGPKVLKSSQNETEFEEILDWGLAQFDGFVGVNNHMGSRLTQDGEAMRRVMAYLKARDGNLFFIDSKTIGSSVAASSAHDAGIPYATRDVFIDHEINKEFIEGALAKLERLANKNGYAIAIGHPHKETITALKTWLPTLKDKGLTLVPASKLIKHPKTTTPSLVAER